ncbi:hypothetical protein AGMMS49545_20500 [Betaproteobacteria bacterium]|nr:hypothetical protein AGMMS49545_20500 [Betaproteobacteria bacterium]GHU46384.1 hypothetical protein AGMMS50289_19710 [Betaproteobacteria bacterium]
MLDANTGEITQVQLGSARRLRTIFQTNVQTSYMAGRYKRYLDNAENRPYWRYVAVMDSRTRAGHAALNGKIWRADDPIWQTLWPPNGWGCRCRVQALSAAEFEKSGAKLEDGKDAIVEKEVVINKDGDTMTVKGIRYIDDTGKEKVFWADPGWDHNPALAADANLREWVARKAQSAPEALKPLYLEQAKRGAESMSESVNETRAPLEKLSKAEGDARAWVLGMGKKTGLEHLVAYDLKTGREVHRMAGEANRVGVDKAELLKAEARGETLRMVHNHPDSVSLSLADLALLRYPAVVEVEAVGANRASSYLTASAPGFSRLTVHLQNRLKKLRKELSAKYNIPFEIYDHIQNLALQQNGMIGYQFRLSSAQKQLLKHENFAAALSEISTVLKGAS